MDEAAIAYDENSDGMYPLITNDRSLTPAQVLEAHKGQPRIEKRFEQLKTVHEIAPVFLKNEGRIEALFTLYFLALLVQALIERELRQAMQAAEIEQIPLYPEARACRRPTTEHILRLFSLAERVTLLAGTEVVRVFPPRTHRAAEPSPAPAGSARYSLRRQDLKQPPAVQRKFGSIDEFDVRNVSRATLLRQLPTRPARNSPP